MSVNQKIYKYATSIRKDKENIQ